MSTDDPKQLLETFLVSASERKTRSLRLIFDICEELCKHPSKNVTVANVGRISQERGGPGAPALRNAAGEQYRLLIDAFAKQADGSKSKTTGKSAALEEILEGVNDQVLRTRVSLLLAELASCRAQLLALRHLANQTAVLDLRKQEPESVLPASTEKPSLEFSLQEMSAMEAAISSETLSHWGWQKDSSGRVSSESGQIVFRAGFVTAIEKLVAFYAI